MSVATCSVDSKPFSPLRDIAWLSLVLTVFNKYFDVLFLRTFLHKVR